jgi:hypothetical protein
MDLLSLITFLDTGSIHFSNLKDLFKFDPREGTGGLFTEIVNSNPRPSLVVFPSSPEIEAQNRKELEELEINLSKSIQSQTQKFNQKIAAWDAINRNVFISCWHVNSTDTDFMWRVYGAMHYGFAIEVGAEDLMNAFVAAGISRQKISCGFVLYSTRDEILRMNFPSDLEQYAAFLIKSPEFMPEKELRFFVHAISALNSCNVPVDISLTKARIHVSPFMPDWAAESVIKVVNQLCSTNGLSEAVYRPRRVRLCSS